MHNWAPSFQEKQDSMCSSMTIEGDRIGLFWSFFVKFEKIENVICKICSYLIFEYKNQVEKNCIVLWSKNRLAQTLTAQCQVVLQNMKKKYFWGDLHLWLEMSIEFYLSHYKIRQPL